MKDNPQITQINTDSNSNRKPDNLRESAQSFEEYVAGALPRVSRQCGTL